MQERSFLKEGSLRAVCGALLSWLLCAAILLPVAALILWKSGRYASAFGYVSSALSFLAAVSAGAAIRKRGRGAAAELLLTMLALIVVLMTVGYFTGKRILDPSAVLSLCSFTLAGCLLGYVMSRRNKAVTKSKRVQFGGYRKR